MSIPLSPEKENVVKRGLPEDGGNKGQQGVLMSAPTEIRMPCLDDVHIESQQFTRSEIHQHLRHARAPLRSATTATSIENNDETTRATARTVSCEVRWRSRKSGFAARRLFAQAISRLLPSHSQPRTPQSLTNSHVRGQQRIEPAERIDMPPTAPAALSDFVASLSYSCSEAVENVDEPNRWLQE